MIGKEGQCVNTGRKCMGAPAWVSTSQSGHALTIWDPPTPPPFWILNVTNKGFNQGPGVNVNAIEGKLTLICVIKYCLLGSVISV